MRSLGKDRFAISSNHDNYLVALMLKRQRQRQGLSIQDVSKRLSYRSKTSYAQYESGRHMPGLDKLSSFLSAINPKLDLSLNLLSHPG